MCLWANRQSANWRPSWFLGLHFLNEDNFHLSVHVNKRNMHFWVYVNNFQNIGAFKTMSGNQESSPCDVGQDHYKLQRACRHSDSAPKRFDLAHYKLFKLCSQNGGVRGRNFLNVCKRGLWKKIARIPFNTIRLCYQHLIVPACITAISAEEGFWIGMLLRVKLVYSTLHWIQRPECFCFFHVLIIPSGQLLVR